MTKTAPLWVLCSLNDETLSEKTNPSLEFDYVDISNVTEGVISNELESLTFGTAPSRARRIARSGDVIVSTVRTYLRAIAQIKRHKRQRIYSTGFAVLRPNTADTDPRYLAYVLGSGQVMDEIVATSVGVSYPAIQGTALHRIRVPHHDLPTQQRIADYLDRETGEIDAMIAKMNQLAETLVARRRRAISHFVTGYQHWGKCEFHEPTWQGQTPIHWAQVPIGMFLFPTEEQVGDAWKSSQLLSLTKQGIVVRDIDSGHGKFPASFEKYQFIYPNDLVMCLFDIDETPRTIGRSRLQGMITNAYTRFVVDETIADTRFIEWVFTAVDDVKGLRPLYSGLRKTVRKSVLLNERLNLPPLEEQKRIADHLDEVTSRIDQMLAKVAELKSLLAERRAALITEVVTGRKEVA